MGLAYKPCCKLIIVGVCPGAQAAKAKRAKEETPGVRATSEALLLRALVDSRDALMLLDTKGFGKETHMYVCKQCAKTTMSDSNIQLKASLSFLSSACTPSAASSGH